MHRSCGGRWMRHSWISCQELSELSYCWIHGCNFSHLSLRRGMQHQPNASAGARKQGRGQRIAHFIWKKPSRCSWAVGWSVFFVATIFLEGNDCVRVSHNTYLTGGLYSDGRMEACDLGSQSLRCFLWSVHLFWGLWSGLDGDCWNLKIFASQIQPVQNESSVFMQRQHGWSKPSGLRNEQKIDSTLIRPFQASLRRKVVSFLDACDAALDPVYLFFEAGLATWHQSNTGSFFFCGISGVASWKQEKASKASGRFHMSWDWKGQGHRS